MSCQRNRAAKQCSRHSPAHACVPRDTVAERRGISCLSSGHPQVKQQVRNLADDGGGEEFKPLTAEEAAAWRTAQVSVSPWRVLALQALAGLVMVALVAALTGRLDWVASVAWGALSVCLPAVVFARALARQMRQARPGSALVGLFVWELVKVGLTVALLLVAPRVVTDLSWWALLAGFVVTLKMYWLAMVLQMRRRRQPEY